MTYKLNELKQLVREAKYEVEWSNYLARIKGSPLLESPDFLKEASILKNKHPFKAIFVLGPAGAGKSFLSKQIGIPKDFKVSNPDERIEQVFPAFGVSMKFVTKQQSAQTYDIQQTARKIMSNATAGHTGNLLMIANPLVFDTTGEDTKKILSRAENLMRLGYDVAIFQVNVPTDVSVSRDQQRKRTVGEPTKTISQQYQKSVVQGGDYIKAAENYPYMTILGGAIYPNLYDLRNNTLLPGITQDQVDQVAPGFTPEQAKDLLAQARSDVQKFLTPEPANPTGKKILSGMKAMVKVTGGKYGQNMNHLSFAGAVMGEYPEIKDNPAIVAAIKVLEQLAGEDGTIQKAMMGGVNPETGEWEKGSKQAIKGKKDVGDSTVRGKTGSGVGSRKNIPAPDPSKKKFEERLSKEAIYEIVRKAIKGT